MRYYLPRLARGLTYKGLPQKRRVTLTPHFQKLVDDYKRRMARDSKPAILSAIEHAWRTERASMGEIKIPDFGIRFRWDREDADAL